MCPTTVHDFQWMVAATRVAHKWQMRGDFPASMWLITELKRSLCTAEAVTVGVHVHGRGCNSGGTACTAELLREYVEQVLALLLRRAGGWAAVIG